VSAWDDLVDRAAAQVQGLDWQGIEAKFGEGALFTPAGETFVFEQYVIPAVEMLGDVIRKYEWLPTDAEIAEMDLDDVRAWRSSMQSVKSRAAEIADAYDADVPDLEEGVEFSTAAVRMSVINAYLVAVYGVDLWMSPPIMLRAALFQHSEGTPIWVVEAQLKEHLDSIFRTCKAIVWLDDVGAFFWVPKKGATSGLGAIAIPAYIVIVGVLALVLLVGMLYYMKRAADISDKSLVYSDEMCKRAQDAGDVETVRTCLETFSNERGAATEAIASAASDAIRQATKWGLIGVGTLAAVYMLPTLVPRVIKAKSAARRAKAEA
jgi:hypothetical protein